MISRLTSNRFPYIPLRLRIRALPLDLEAFFDSGFDGDLTLPPTLAPQGQSPDAVATWRLADGGAVAAAEYLGVIDLGPLGTYPVQVTAIGDELLIGRGITDRFSVLLDYGQRLVIEA